MYSYKFRNVFKGVYYKASNDEVYVFNSTMEGCNNSFIVISYNKNTLLQFDTCTGETITAIEIPGTKGDFSTQSVWANNQTLMYFEWNYVYYYKITPNKD